MSKKNPSTEKMMQDIMKKIEETNENSIKLMYIIHFYESFVFNLKLIIKNGFDHDDAIREKAKFLEKIVNTAEDRAEEMTETTLYKLYQDQNFMNKEGVAKPVPRTYNNEPIDKNKLN
jgi:hypothetical protein